VKQKRKEVFNWEEDANLSTTWVKLRNPRKGARGSQTLEKGRSRTIRQKRGGQRGGGTTAKARSRSKEEGGGGVEKSTQQRKGAQLQNAYGGVLTRTIAITD